MKVRLLLGIIAVLFVSVLYLLYLNFSPKKTIVVDNQPTPSPTISNWKTYKNKDYGFTFQYPSDLNYSLDPPAPEGYVFKNSSTFISLVIDSRCLNTQCLSVLTLDEILRDRLNLDILSSFKIGQANAKKIKNGFLVEIPNTTKYITINSGLPTPVIDQILSTFKFNSSPVNTPTPSTPLFKIKIQDTSSWLNWQCGSISFKLPGNYTQRCYESTNGSYIVDYGIDGKYYGNHISVNPYDGGSRRQYWIKLMTVTDKELAKYTRIQESQYGSVSGLAIFASGGWWQGGNASAILIAHNKTIVSIGGAQNFNDQTGEITHDPIADTIASTIKFIQ